MTYELVGEYRPQYDMIDEEGNVIPPEDSRSFTGRVARKWREAGETAKSGIEGFLETFEPTRAESFPEFVKEKGGATLRALAAPFAPVQAITGTFIGAPVEHALASVLPEETAEIGGIVAELATPLIAARLAQAGRARIPQTSAGIAASELLGIPREVAVPQVEPVEALTRETAPESFRAYRHPLEAPPEPLTQLELKLPTEPSYRPRLMQEPITPSTASLEEALAPSSRWGYDLPMDVPNEQLTLFTPGRQHTTKVQRFREIAGRAPSAKEMQQFKNLGMDDVEELASHSREIRELQQQLSDPAAAIPPTRALAAATEELEFAKAAEALGARHVGQDIRESVQDRVTQAANKWYTQTRPGGTTLAGSVAGSLAGFEQDDEGNWMFDPGKALLGFGAGSLAIGAIQSPQLGNMIRNAANWLSKVRTGAQIPTERTADLTNKLTRSIVFPHTAAELEPGFAPIYATGMKFFENRALTGGIFAEKLGDVTKGVSKRLTQTLYLGNVTGREFTTAQLRGFGLSGDEIRQYGQIRNALDYSLDALERHLVQSGVDAGKAATLVGSMRKRGFMPQTRFGPYKIAIEDAQGNLIGFFQDETKAAHQVSKANVQANLQTGERMRAYYRPDPPHSEFGGMDIHVMSILSEVDDEVKKILGNSPDAEKLSKLIASATHRVSGFPIHMLKQKSLPGFSQDVPRVLADYGRSLSQYIARREAIHASAPYVTALSAAGKSHWADYSQRYIKELTNPTGDMGALREGLFLYYLAGKFSSALVNLSGYLTLGYPVVGRYTSNAAKHWSKAIATAFKADKDLPSELAGGLRLAKLEGVVADPTTQELLGTASGRNATLRGVTDLAGALFGKAETGIRRATYIAGHNIATEELKLKGDAAHEFAKKLTREANLDYTKADRPEFVRAGWKAPFGTFRLFQWNVLSKFKDAIKRGEFGTLARHAGTLGAVAGLVGMPGAKTIIDLARDNGYDIPTWVRSKFGRVGEVALRGPVYAAGALWGEPDKGIDLSGSAGIGDVVPSELFNNPFEGVSKLIAGVLADPFVRANRAKNLAMQGEYGRAAEAFLPESLRALSVATRAGQAGEFRTAFDEPIVPATAFDIGMRAMGFQPSAVSRSYEREAAERSLRYVATGQSERFYRQLARAIVGQDAREVQAAIRAIQDYNANARPEARIELGSNSARYAIRRHVMQLTIPAQTEIRSLPKKARARYQMIQEVHR